MDKRPHKTQETTEKSAEETHVEPEVPPEPEPGDKKTRGKDTLQEMLFREAEVIARNLKESGTRR